MSTLLKIFPPGRLFAVVQFLLFIVSANAQDYEIKEAPFNSKEADFSATFNGNEIIFCSTRARKVLSFSEDTINTYYTDLYSVKLKSDGTYSTPEPLKGKVNTLLNEGQATFSPDGKVMYYTANLPATPGKKARKSKEFLLGLFKAEKVGDEWIPIGPFEYNSLNGKFSVAHPCYSPDGNYIYFSSNMPGGKGGSDIYRCKREDGKWSAPENLGDAVNTRGNEFFPFVNDYGTLYFSSDAREDSEGMDIYSSELEDAGYVSVQKLNSTINSEYDDFAYCEIQGVNKGVLSSNRTGDDDNIFLFIKYSNNSNDCLENPDRQLCYAVKDLNLAELTDLPLKYKWNMGDGTELYGSEVEYCYKSPGDYRISLCVVDTLTKSVFADVSHTDIHIDSQSKPYITSTDTIYAGKKFDFFIDLSMFTDFEVNEIIWETSDGESFSGDHATHQFASSGAAQLTCYVKGKKKSNGVVPRVCIYKDIYVTNEEIYSTVEEPVTCCQAKRATVVYMDAGNGEKQADGDDKDYKLVIAKSDTPLPLNDQKFKKVTRKIVEYKEPDNYIYYVEKASTWSDLLPQYAELRKAGITDMSVMEISDRS